MVLVTGASGFIGKHVVRKLLDKKEKIIVLIRDKGNYAAQGTEIIVEGDLGDIASWKEAVKSYPVETCIHLAWEGIPDYSYEMSKRNLVYGLHVLDLCAELGIKKLIITGSCWEYKEPKGSISVSHPVTYEKPFQAAKNSLRMMAHAFCKEQGIHFHWLRLFYVYGPGQREGALIPYIMKCFKEGKQPELKGAYNKNDFVYVEDVAEAIVEVTQGHDFPEILNVGSGVAIRVAELCEMVANCMQKEFTTERKRGIQIGADFYANKEEMERAIAWEAIVTIQEGIHNMINEFP